ncbi:MAG: crossover junction endodeoxyribonuclease RuvC [Paramuribaculum sp.]|nr:crossover junction endodeoxyribonuclease RuvC [Candidatus Amulumruptor sp.]MDE6587616.1 crossover junction endodeoxyribonuclease RuvC [Paramuribaculum sp.]MDE7152680.1 crossover junction endodeoxyribonuclease RuvC [Candidatus Amulumruptor sp.]MDE7236393.1 crossover junction endodeoxyribonuclease RuvC [Paramuribaculum sp.]
MTGVADYNRIIIGIDPGTNVMGYALVGIADRRKPEVITMGVIHLSRLEDHYLRLRRIFDRITALVDEYHPDEMALEAPFFGKNVQSMLKLGRAQGVAMAAALERDVPIAEYEPRKVKQAITGTGAASKEQVREILRRTMHISDVTLADLPLDATDALAVAMTHLYETSGPFAQVVKHGAGSAVNRSKPSSRGGWKDFVARNPDRIKN